MTVDSFQRILKRLQKVMILLQQKELFIDTYVVTFDLEGKIGKDKKRYYNNPLVEERGKIFPVVISFHQLVQSYNFDTHFGRTMVKLNGDLDKYLLKNHRDKLLKELDIEYMNNRDLLTKEELDIKDILE